MNHLDNLIEKLKSKSRVDQLQGMAKYGIKTDNRLGVSIPDIRKIAKEFGKNHDVALELWKTNIADARILAALIDEVEKVTSEQMDQWVKDFDSWDVCDQVCMNLFDKTPFAWDKIVEWSNKDEEFVKRAAFALLACLAWHDKKASNEKFIEYLPIVKKNISDDRNYVKKAISWSIRNIGKRNIKLHSYVLIFAEEIKRINTKNAKWIASDIIRDLNTIQTKKRLKIL